MHYYAAVFFAISFVAALLGLTGAAEGSMEIAKIVFIVALALGLLTALFGAPPRQQLKVRASSPDSGRRFARSAP